MRTPLIIDENGDMAVFDTVEDASRFLEPIDVDQGVYVGFDASGSPLNIRTGSAGKGTKRVVLIDASTEVRKEDLVRLLSERLRGRGVTPSESELDVLVRAARDLFLTR